MITIVVLDKETREVIAVIPMQDGEEGIMKNGVDFQIFTDTEPTFQNQDGVLTMNENTFMVNMSDIV